LKGKDEEIKILNDQLSQESKNETKNEISNEILHSSSQMIKQSSNEFSFTLSTIQTEFENQIVDMKNEILRDIQEKQVDEREIIQNEMRDIKSKFSSKISSLSSTLITHEDLQVYFLF